MAGSWATDNGTGTLTMMEALRILRTVVPTPPDDPWWGALELREAEG